MKPLEKSFLVLKWFLTIWVLLFISAVGRFFYQAEYFKPYLRHHADTTASLFYATCIRSSLDALKLESNALKLGMIPLTDLAIPYGSDSQKPYHLTDIATPSGFDGQRQIFARWKIEPGMFFKDKWKYKPFPYEISLDEKEIKGKWNKDSRLIHGSDGVLKLRCAMRMHTGIMRDKSRPYYVTRRGSHNSSTSYVSNKLVSLLRKFGAEVTDVPRQWGTRNRFPKPITFKLEGQRYHLTVSPFSISLVFAGDVDCPNCNLYPQPDIVRGKLDNNLK